MPAFLLLMMVGAILTARSWPLGSKLLPLSAAVPGALLAAWVLVSEMRSETRLALPYRQMGWVLLFGLLIWLLGFLPAVVLFNVAYMLEAKASLRTTALVTLGVFAFVMVVFDLLLTVPWPKGVLVALAERLLE